MTAFFSRLVSTTLLFAALATALPAMASLRDYYVVELIVFSNDLNIYAAEENWPTEPTFKVPEKLRYPAQIGIDRVYPELSALINQREAVANGKSSYLPLLGGAYTEHSAAAKRIERTSRHRLLAHYSWVQKLGDEKSAESVAILAGENVNGFYEIAGSIKLYRSRYIHLQTDLWRSYFIQEGDETSVPLNIILPKITLPGAAQEQSTLAADQQSNEVPTHFIDREVLDQPAVSRVAPMQQKRRMRSREIHHIDHPLFGLIIEVRPFEAK